MTRGSVVSVTTVSFVVLLLTFPGIHGDSIKQPIWMFVDEGRFTDVDISGNGEYVLVGNFNGEYYLFRKSSSSPEWRHTSQESITDVAIGRSGNTLVVGSGDGKVRVLSNSGSTRWEYNSGAYVYSLALSSDEKWLAVGISGYEKNEVLLFDTASNTPVFTMALDGYARKTAISSNGAYFSIYDSLNTFYYVSSEDKVSLWNYSAPDSIRSVSIDGGGSNIVIVSGEKAYVFDKSSNETVWEIEVTGQYGIGRALLSFDGAYVILADYNKRLLAYSLQTKSKIAEYSTDNSIHRLDISEESPYRIVVVTSYGNVIYFDDIALDETWSYELEGSMSGGTVCSISADGEYVAALYEQQIGLFDRQAETPGLSLSVEGASSVEVGAQETFRVSVTDRDNNAIASAYVEVTAEYGIVIPSTGYTDYQGIYEFIYKAPDEIIWSFEHLNVKTSKEGYRMEQGGKTISLREETDEPNSDDQSTNAFFDALCGFWWVGAIIIIFLALMGFLKNPPLRGRRRDAAIHKHYQEAGKYPRFPKK